MHTLRHRMVFRVSRALLAGLLLIPLVLRAHAHGEHHQARACSACVVAHHTPTVIARPPAPPVPMLKAMTVRTAAATAAAHDRPAAPTGRGPPGVFSSRSA